MNTLKLINSKFLNPILTMGLLAPPASHRIFKNIESIRHHNEGFLEELMAIYNSGGFVPLEKSSPRELKTLEPVSMTAAEATDETVDSIKLGHVLSKKISGFRQYVSYIDNFFVSRELIAMNEKNIPFMNFLIEKEERDHLSRISNL